MHRPVPESFGLSDTDVAACEQWVDWIPVLRGLVCGAVGTARDLYDALMHCRADDGHPGHDGRRHIREQAGDLALAGARVKTGGFFITVLLLAMPASAQEMPTVHQVGLAAYAGAAALDYHSTYRVLASGGIEHNPLGRLTQNHPTATVAVGASVDAIATVLLYKWLGKKNPTLTTVLLAAATSVRFSLAVQNYQEPVGRRNSGD
jgi:hypothetical protein